MAASDCPRESADSLQGSTLIRSCIHPISCYCTGSSRKAGVLSLFSTRVQDCLKDLVSRDCLRKPVLPIYNDLTTHGRETDSAPVCMALGESFVVHTCEGDLHL